MKQLYLVFQVPACLLLVLQLGLTSRNIVIDLGKGSSTANNLNSENQENYQKGNNYSLTATLMKLPPLLIS
jgi:hypothetical protein